MAVAGLLVADADSPAPDRLTLWKCGYKALYGERTCATIACELAQSPQSLHSGPERFDRGSLCSRPNPSLIYRGQP